MLKFFKKIRQKLLTENKFSKYLLYAIGEIILVVIGILIALSINNWNEYLKDRIVEKEILQNMVESLQINIQKMQSHIEANAYCDKSSAIILYAIDNKLTYNDSLNNHFGWALSVEDPGTLISFVGYESLKQAGTGIIHDSQLKKEIINLFEETFQLPLARKDRMMNYTMELVKLRQQYFLRGEGFKFAPLDYDSLIKDKYYYSWLRTIKNSRSWFNESIEESLKETQRVLQLIIYKLKESD